MPCLIYGTRSVVGLPILHNVMLSAIIQLYFYFLFFSLIFSVPLSTTSQFFSLVLIMNNVFP